MRVLITGKNSFIGAYFKDEFQDSFTLSDVCLIENIPSNLDFLGVDVVFHVAAIVHQMKGAPKENYFKVNSDLAFETALKAKKDGVKQFVFMSTVKVYGEYTEMNKPWTENSICKPLDPYGESKLDAETRLLELANTEFKVSIIRTPVVYGPGVKGNIINLVRLIEKYPIIPLGNIKNLRSFISVKNLSYFIFSVINKGESGIFLASEGSCKSTSELVMEISKHFKGNWILPIPRIVQDFVKIFSKSIHQRIFGNLELDNAKSIRELSFQPPMSFEEGVKEMIDWYKLNKSK